jgi:hypothetical protein
MFIDTDLSFINSALTACLPSAPDRPSMWWPGERESTILNARSITRLAVAMIHENLCDHAENHAALYRLWDDDLRKMMRRRQFCETAGLLCFLVAAFAWKQGVEIHWIWFGLIVGTYLIISFGEVNDRREQHKLPDASLGFAEHLGIPSQKRLRERLVSASTFLPTSPAPSSRTCSVCCPSDLASLRQLSRDPDWLQAARGRSGHLAS